MARKIQWRVWAGAGTSRLFDPPTGKKASADAAPTNGSVGNGGNPPIGFVSYAAPERSAAGSYAVGASIIYPLGKRVQLEAGISYQMLSTRQRVGAFHSDTSSAPVFTSNSNERSYYSYGTQGSYRNQYHTIQVPVQLGWNLHPRVTLSGGLGFSYLVGSNALQFDEGTGRSYRGDVSTLKRTAVSLLGGARYRFWKKGPRSIDAGPVLQLGLSPIETGSGKRFSYFGLQAGFQF